MEGTVSQNVDVGPSFYFKPKNGKIILFQPFPPIGPYLASLGPLSINMTNFLRLFGDYITDI